ncbi:MAG: hypothetical protein K2N48_08420 [Muribaculaceae bacterium]|nr:hypothetical protein [Muribaculaceae bacterium]
MVESQKYYNWLPSFGYQAFSKKNCPIAHILNRNQVPSYKDWIALLGGGREGYSDNVSGWLTWSNCIKLMRSENANDWLGIWGRTLGTYKGPNNTPLCESKPLDGLFFYYLEKAESKKTFVGNIEVKSLTDSEHMVYLWGADKNAFTKFFKKDVNNDSTGFYNGSAKTEMVLSPGVYGLALFGSTLRTTTAYFRFQLKKPDGTWEDLARNYTTGHNTTAYTYWSVTNGIFFVDSPVTIRFYHTVSKWEEMTMVCEIFRFTPPGYWKP